MSCVCVYLCVCARRGLQWNHDNQDVERGIEEKKVELAEFQATSKQQELRDSITDLDHKLRDNKRERDDFKGMMAVRLVCVFGCLGDVYLLLRCVVLRCLALSCAALVLVLVLMLCQAHCGWSG